MIFSAVLACALLASPGLGRAQKKEDASHFINAVSFYNKGLYQEAAAEAALSIKTLPVLGDYALYYRAISLAELQKDGEALEALKALQALACHPGSPVRQKARALAIKLTADKDEQLKLLAAYYDRYPGDSGMALAYGLLLKQRGSALADGVLSELYTGAGSESAEALAALGRKPRPAEVLTRAGNLVKASRYAEAGRELEAALPALEREQKVEALNLLGRTLFEQRKYTEAATIYMQADNTYEAARAFFRCGDEASFANAVGTLEKDRDGRAGDLVLALAEKKRRGGRPEDSLKLLARVKQDYPERKEDVLWESGWLYFRQKDYAGALAAFSELAGQSDNPCYLYWKARTMELLGGNAEADWEKLRAGTGYYAVLASLRTPQQKGACAEKKTEAAGLQWSLARSGRLDFTRARILSEAGLKEEAVLEVLQQMGRCSQPGDLLDIIYKLRDMGDFKQALRIALRLPEKLQPGDVIYPRAFWKEVEGSAGRYSLDPLLLLSVIREESRFDPAACSTAGAIGLMQLMPGTASRFSARLKADGEGGGKLTDPGTNVAYGGYYLKQLIGEMGSLPAALAAYNAGEQAVKSWLEEGKYPATDEFIEDIPYGETKNYVKRIITSYFYYKEQDGAALEAAGF